MFTRVTRGAYRCSRCQRQLRGQILHAGQLPGLAGLKLPHRHQSTATAVATNDEVDTLDDEATSPFEGRSEALRYSSRIWRPVQTEELGLPALGKPAEVLVLPSRDRKIPQVPAGDTRPAQGIQASLESEQDPLTPEQVIENIDHIKAQIQATGALENEVLKRLRRSLVKGFRGKQLTRYIESRQGKTLKELKLPTSGTTWKVRLVNYILYQIWCLRSVDGPPAVQEEAKQVGLPRTLKLSSPVLQALLAQRGSSLQSVAEKENVRIDTYIDRLVLTPFSGSGHTAVENVSRMKKEVLRSRLALDIGLQNRLPKDENELRELFSVIGRKNEVFIQQKASNVLVIFHRGNRTAVVERIRRELVRACIQGKQSQRCKFRMWPERNHPPLIPAPMSNQVSPTSMPSIALCRWVFAEKLHSAVKKLGLLSSSGSSQSNTTLRSLQDLLYPPKFVRETQHQRISARFGQCLFDAQSPGPLQNGLQGNLEFSERIPNKSQYLASLCEQPSISETSKVFYRLVLRPEMSSVLLPTFEVIIFRDDPANGPHSGATVRSVVAILDFRCCGLLLPGSPFDILFQHEILHPVLAGKKSTAQSRKLVRELTTYLEASFREKIPQFMPLVTLNVPGELRIAQHGTHQRAEKYDREAAQKPTAMPKGQTQHLTTAEAEETVEGVNNAELVGYVKDVTNDDNRHNEPYIKSKYVLQSADVMELKSFNLGKDVPELEYITLQGGDYGPAREVLQVSQPPSIDAQESVKPSMVGKAYKRIFEGALKVVKGLSWGGYRGNQD